MQKIILNAPFLDRYEFARSESIRTVLAKLNNERKHFAELTEGKLAYVRISKCTKGYKIEYSEDLSGIRFRTKEPLNRKTTEKALIAYLRKSEEWKNQIEFEKKRDIAYLLGYALGKIFKPFIDFIRGVKIGYKKTQKAQQDVSSNE